jgi:hypothetical protein
MPTPKSTPGTTTGAPFPLAANRPLSALAESPPPSAVQVHAAALGRVQWPFFIRRGAAAARRRRGRPGHPRVPLRYAAQPKPKTATAARVQEDAEARRGTLWEARRVRSGREGGDSARRLTAPAIPPASCPIPPRAACAVGACRRRSPIQRGGRQQPTQHSVTSARAACLVVHDCTRGSKCRANRARAAA